MSSQRRAVDLILQRVSTILRSTATRPSTTVACSLQGNLRLEGSAVAFAFCFHVRNNSLRYGFHINGCSQFLGEAQMYEFQVLKMESVAIPNAAKALQHQRSLKDLLGPTYNAHTNSCVTHILNVLSAGGLECPSTSLSQAKFLMNLNFKLK